MRNKANDCQIVPVSPPVKHEPETAMLFQFARVEPYDGQFRVVVVTVNEYIGKTRGSRVDGSDVEIVGQRMSESLAAQVAAMVAAERSIRSTAPLPVLPEIEGSIDEELERNAAFNGLGDRFAGNT
jgi:hypothetical protein